MSLQLYSQTNLNFSQHAQTHPRVLYIHNFYAKIRCILLYIVRGEYTCYGRPCFHHSEQTASAENFLQRALNWIQRLKTVSKIYHFVSLHQQSIGIVFCWADELVEGLFCDGLLYKAASKIIFSLIFIQQQRFDFNHLLQKFALTDVWFETLLEILLKWSK